MSLRPVKNDENGAFCAIYIFTQFFEINMPKNIELSASSLGELHGM